MYLPWLKRTHFAFSLSVLLAVVAVALLGSRASAVERKDIQTLGVPFVGSVGVQRTNADILAEEKRHEGEPIQADPIWRNEFEFERGRNLRREPGIAARRVDPAMPVNKLIYTPPGSRTDPTSSARRIGPQLHRRDTLRCEPTNAFPPDCDGAIGPTQYVVGVNGRIVSFNKFTGLQDGMMSYSTDASPTPFAPASAERSYGPLRPPVGTLVRPHDHQRVDSNRYLIGVSDAASNGVITWAPCGRTTSSSPRRSRLRSARLTPTTRRLGIDANALYMGGDGSASSFQQTDGFVVRRPRCWAAGRSS
jgi:hypothetical protein